MSANPSAQEWYDKGDAARRAGDLQQADEAFRRAVASDPTHANALYRLGELALFRGEREAANELFRRTLAIQPGHVWALKQLERMSKKPAPPSSAEIGPAQPTNLPTCPPVGPGIVGTVQSVRRSSENFEFRSGSRPVLTIRVRRQMPGEPPGPVLGAEIRGKQIRGDLSAGDWVQFPARWVPGRKLSVVRNLTTCDEVKVVENRLTSVVTALIVAFVTVWIAVSFFVVARKVLFD